MFPQFASHGVVIHFYPYNRSRYGAFGSTYFLVLERSGFV